MKTQNFKNNNNGQGSATANRAFIDENEILKERGIGNSGGQRSDQTSNIYTAHKPEKKKR